MTRDDIVNSNLDIQFGEQKEFDGFHVMEYSRGHAFGFVMWLNDYMIQSEDNKIAVVDRMYVAAKNLRLVVSGEVVRM